jgi:Rod binding domain-containing protein
MSSVQSALLGQPLPLSEAFHVETPARAKIPNQDPQKVAQDFESLFTSMMLKEMRKTLEPGTLFGEDSNDVYGGMFDQFLGQHMANSNGIGLANMVQQTLERSIQAEEASRAMGIPIP